MKPKTTVFGASQRRAARRVERLARGAEASPVACVVRVASSETLRKYGVPSEASRRALDEHWQEQLAARPELRAELDAAVEMYTRWLRGLPG